MFLFLSTIIIINKIKKVFDQFFYKANYSPIETNIKVNFFKKLKKIILTKPKRKKKHSDIFQIKLLL